MRLNHKETPDEEIACGENIKLEPRGKNSK